MRQCNHTLAPKNRPKNVAVVLAGAITRGAFEAGVLKVIAEREIPVRRIVAASSGALNGAAFGAGIRRRRPLAAAEELICTWIHEGGFWEVININCLDLLAGRGLSNQDKLLSVLRRHVLPLRVPDPAPIELHIVVAPLNGALGWVHGQPATTYIAMLSFDGDDFDRNDPLERIFKAATASAAFPGIYSPVYVPGLGPCVDGGLVNSTPISYACGPSDPPIDAALVIVPTAAYGERYARRMGGRELVAHLVDMLFEERLFQDLGREQCVPIIVIRPDSPLPGDAFTGFFRKEARMTYVDAGITRARQVLDALGWR